MSSPGAIKQKRCFIISAMYASWLSRTGAMSSSLAPVTLWAAKMRQWRFSTLAPRWGDRKYCAHSSAVEELLLLHFGRKASP